MTKPQVFVCCFEWLKGYLWSKVYQSLKSQALSCFVLLCPSDWVPSWGEKEKRWKNNRNHTSKSLDIGLGYLCNLEKFHVEKLPKCCLQPCCRWFKEVIWREDSFIFGVLQVVCAYTRHVKRQKSECQTKRIEICQTEPCHSVVTICLLEIFIWMQSTTSVIWLNWWHLFFYHWCKFYN